MSRSGHVMLNHYERRAQTAMTAMRHNQNRYPVLGDYVVLPTVIGKGSYGIVRVSLNLETLRPVAVKIIHKKKARELASSFSVRKEIKIMQELQHPNIVRLIDVVSTHSKVLLMMELVTGGELYDEVEHFGHLSEPYARFYFQQLVRGLDFCHSKGIYHRDLKPDNLLLDRNKTLKIADFGLGTFFGKNNPANHDTAMLHTPVGTPHYIAPELIALSPEGYSGAKADAWSCGVILYVMCSGCMPFENNNVYKLFHQIKKCYVEYPPHFSEDLKDLLGHIFQSNPSTRYSLRQMSRHRWFSGPVATSEVGDDRRERPDTLDGVSEQIQEVLREYNAYKEAAASRKPSVNIPVVLNRPTPVLGSQRNRGSSSAINNDSLALGWIQNNNDVSMTLPGQIGESGNILNASTLDVIMSEGESGNILNDSTPNLDLDHESNNNNARTDNDEILGINIDINVDDSASNHLPSLPSEADSNHEMSQVSEPNENNITISNGPNVDGYKTDDGEERITGASERWPRTISNGKISYQSFGFESPADSDLSQQLQAFLRKARSLSDLGKASSNGNSAMNMYSGNLGQNIRLEVGDCDKVNQLRHSLWNRFGVRLKAAENTDSSSYNISSLTKEGNSRSSRSRKNNNSSTPYNIHNQDKLLRSKTHVGRLQARVRKELRSHRSEEAAFYHEFKQSADKLQSDDTMDDSETRKDRKVSFKVPEFLEKEGLSVTTRAMSDDDTMFNNNKVGDEDDNNVNNDGNESSSSDRYGDHISNMWEGKSNVAWCRLMRDIGMIPDQEEFGVDSQTLESRWFAALDPDGKRRAKRSRKGKKRSIRKSRARQANNENSDDIGIDNDSNTDTNEMANGATTFNPMFHHYAPSIIKGDILMESGIPTDWIQKFVDKTGFNRNEPEAIARALYRKKVPKNEVQPAHHYKHIMERAKGAGYVAKLNIERHNARGIEKINNMNIKSSPANTLLGNEAVLKATLAGRNISENTPALKASPGNVNSITNNNNTNYNSNNQEQATLNTTSPDIDLSTPARRHRANQKLKTVAIGPLHEDYRRVNGARNNNADVDDADVLSDGSDDDNNHNGSSGKVRKGTWAWYDDSVQMEAAEKRDFMRKLKITDMDIPGPSNDLTIPAPLPFERYLRKPIQYMKRCVTNRVQLLPAFDYRVKYSFHTELTNVIRAVRELLTEEGGTITEVNKNSNIKMLVDIADNINGNNNSNRGSSSLQIVVRFIEDRCSRLLIRRSKGSKLKYAEFISGLEPKLERKLHSIQQLQQTQKDTDVAQVFQQTGGDKSQNNDDIQKLNQHSGDISTEKNNQKQEQFTVAQLVPG